MASGDRWGEPADLDQLHSRTVRDAVRGALLGTFVGDALGMPYEGKPGHAIPERVEMRDGRAPAGSYTDDTQMMIALAESLLRCDGIDPEDLAASFRSHYEPERGYGSGTRGVIALWDEGVAVMDAAGRIMGGEGSSGNGAAMRVAPVGVRFWRDEETLVSAARRSALVTHAHPEGVDGAVVQAVAVGAAVAGRDPLGAARTVAQTPMMQRRLDEAAASASRGLDPRELGGPAWAVGYSAGESVPIAVTIGSLARDFEHAVSLAVRCGGDTDTVAAMAGAIAGARFGAGTVPARWYEALEEGERGRSHVERLAAGLATAGP